MKPRRRTERTSASTVATTKAVDAWLQEKPDLEAMRERFPDEWQAVERELAEALAARSADRLDSLLLRDAGAVATAAVVLHRGERTYQERVMRLLRRRMAILALEGHATALASVADGGSRMGRLSRALTTGLFFRPDGTKKPASVRVFRWSWPFVRAKGAFLAAAQAKGTYCFLSGEFVDEVAKLCGERSCLEIAAGDGTLSRFLRERGVSVVATDDGSWNRSSSGAPDVLRKDAATALADFRPEVVLCSWPPPGNAFEAEVFATETVQAYLVVGSLHDFATGARSAYETQRTFRATRRQDLERLVLPPEIGTEVLLFERIADA